ncbi:MauE/DoxX family redox-associated membrane protein [Pseudonocardia sp.]|uniref:MauE/DoxX family redox-associated membrane protein n=1 Tax=Pseudonocardia sp. TaxID=60912 RepID=UPI00262B698B|nr:MauE/DoxX family redox-associated membrane protein [Pseudonocardia sp.]
MNLATDHAGPTLRGALPWLSTLARLVLGTAWIVAGATKITDLDASVRAVRAYRLLPETAAQIVGAGLPPAEILLGVLLVVGVGVRAGAVVSAVLMAAFVVGIVSAWARGLRIDCGCFGTGGELAVGEDPAYGWDLLRDAGLLALALALARWPVGRFGIDGALEARRARTTREDG